MIQTYLSTVFCNEETDGEIGADEPYVLVTAVDLRSPIPTTCDVKKYGPWEDVDTGDQRNLPGASDSFWGIFGGPAPLNNPDDAILVVGVNEWDDGKPETLRGLVKDGAVASLASTAGRSRPEKVTKLIADINSHMGTPTGFPNLDDRIGGPQELQWSTGELAQAQRGQPVAKNLVFSGDGGKYTLTFHASGVHRLRSFNFRDRFIRHQAFLGELTLVATDLDRQDSLFEFAFGLAERGPATVSLQSKNFPNHYLRHQNFRVKLHRLGDPGQDQVLFRRDATFIVVPGLADSNGVSFRSFNFQDRFLRHRDFHLFVEPGSGDVFRKDATFLLD